MKCIVCGEDSVDGYNVCKKHLELRNKVQAISREKGHCTCTRPIEKGGKPCPCKSFLEFQVCHCAGEDNGTHVPDGYRWY